ncbi:MAG TPA: adenosylhomocysteinase, partial [bacterium (Candidatus Stahlbacteria)]|nr:adenosylhomocysteinase [Candidatus Stahlbacteria bacterium]
MKYDIKDIKLAGIGGRRIGWADQRMKVLRMVRDEFRRKKPLKDLTISCCLHVTTETANLMITLKTGGAKPLLCASNPLSTQDDVAAALVKYHKIPVFAYRGENRRAYYQHINAVLREKPDILIDDGADLIATAHKNRIIVIGGTEETTTGVIRLRSLEQKRRLTFPVIAVNDSMTKHLFDNRYGTGQSTIDGILRATNILLSGLSFVVCGYGWCGRGIAMRARGMGAEVIVCEVDPIRALEARMDGFRVMSLDDAARIGDVFVTATGDVRVITRRHFLRMKDGVILANAGHFDVE